MKLQRLFSSSSVTTTNNAGCFPGVDSTPLLLDNLYKVFNHVIVCRTDAVNQKKLFAYVNSSTYPFFCACQNVVIWKRSVHLFLGFIRYFVILSYTVNAFFVQGLTGQSKSWQIQPETAIIAQ